MEDKTRHTVVLYTKPGCHLCELTRDLLRGLEREFVLNIREIDISADVQLFERFHDKIPVLIINETVKLEAPIRMSELRRALTEPLTTSANHSEFSVDSR